MWTDAIFDRSGGPGSCSSLSRSLIWSRVSSKLRPSCYSLTDLLPQMPQSLVGCPEVRLNGRNSAAPSFFMSYSSAQLQLSIEHPSCISLPSFTYRHLLKESSEQVSSSRVRLIFLHAQKYLQGCEEVMSFSFSTSFPYLYSWFYLIHFERIV